MKGKLIILILFVFSLSLVAQDISITNSTQNIANGKNPCYVVIIPNTNAKTVANAWKSEMKKAKAKVKGSDKTTATNALLPDISSNSMDIYANFSQENNNVKMVVAFSLSGIFLTPENNTTAHNAATNYLRQFALQQYKNQLAADLAMQKKQVKGTEKDIKNLNKDIKKLTKENEKLTKQIEKNNQTIKQYNEEIINKQKILQSQESKLEDLKKQNKK
jgi:hypothetical protein